MELENVLKLITAVSNSSLTNFTLDDGTIKLSLSAGREQTQSEPVGESSENVKTVKTKAVDVSETAVNMSADVENNQPDTTAEGHAVVSPLVGIFYSASSPDEKPFVSVGDTVKKGQVLGIVEAMKLMNEIESDYDGVVKEILVSNEQMVEYGQPMFVIE